MKFYTIKHKPTNLFLSDIYYVNDRMNIGFYKEHCLSLSNLQEIDEIVNLIKYSECEIKLETETKEINYLDFEIKEFIL